MIKEALRRLVERQSLNAEEASQVMAEIMEGKVTGAQFGSLVTALRIKGETEEEITGFARTMRQKAVPLITPWPVIDTCGMGGDSAGTFNISTTTAFVVAAAGLKVAKHGNRAVSSRCGSADVLEALGVKIDLSPDAINCCLERVGMAFLFAPVFHPAMKYAAGPRQELGIRTVFNLLGPLANPAHANCQVVGVTDERVAVKIARVLKELGSHSAMVVHGKDGLDELTVCSTNVIVEVRGGAVEKYQMCPEEAGLKRYPPGSLAGGTADENALLLRGVLAGEKGPRRDAVLFNAAAALKTGGAVNDIPGGVGLAGRLIDEGKALEKLESLIKISQECSRQ